MWSFSRKMGHCPLPDCFFTDVANDAHKFLLRSCLIVANLRERSSSSIQVLVWKRFSISFNIPATLEVICFSEWEPYFNRSSFDKTYLSTFRVFRFREMCVSDSDCRFLHGTQFVREGRCSKYVSPLLWQTFLFILL